MNRIKNSEIPSPEVYNDKPWFKIDNAAILYAAAKTKKWSRTFRVSLVLNNDINEEILQKALDATTKRYPFFCVQLREGLFWSYFERMDERVIAEKESDYPYRPVGLEGSGSPCFRVLYFKNRLSLECFHSLTDANGAFTFISYLAAIYLSMRGENITPGGIVSDLDTEAKASEAADSYYAHYDPAFSAKNPPKVSIYLMENEPLKNFSNVIHGICEVSNVKDTAKKHSLTITEYFTAVLIYTFYTCASKPIKSPISISVPIDLRRRFESKAMRNFVFMTDITFDTKGRNDITFDEICDCVRGKLAEKATKESLLPEISSNVSAASNKLLRLVPYFFKKIFLIGTYKKVQQTYTGFFSNVGVLDLPEEMRKHIARAEFYLGETPYQHFGCAAASVGNILTFTFTSGNKNTERQKFFFRFLAADGIRLRIESNTAE